MIEERQPVRAHKISLLNRNLGVITGVKDADYVDDDEDYGYDPEFEDDDVDGSVDEDDNEPV